MERIENALKGLLIKEPFYGLFCLKLHKTIDHSIDTLAVSRKDLSITLRVNPDFFMNYDEDLQIQLIKHEILHICFGHLFSFKGIDGCDQYLIDLANDYEVNSYIDYIQGGLFPQDKGWEKCMGTKWYYEQLKSEFENEDSSSVSINSLNVSSGPLGNTLDCHGTWEEFNSEDTSEDQIIKDTVEGMIKQVADETEKSCGSLPGELVHRIEQLRNRPKKTINWREVFKRLLGTIWSIETKRSRLKENVRFPDNAGSRHKRKARLFVALDTSGSLSEKDFQIFFAELHNVWEEGCGITIVECDTQCYEPFEYKGKKIEFVHGRGGTDFHPAIDMFLERKSKYSAMIYCTDGYCKIPDNCPKNIIWVLTPDHCDKEYPGKVIRIPKIVEQ